MALVSGRRDDKVMMFIDIRNILESAQTLTGPNSPVGLDLYLMARTLAGSRELVAAYVFDSRMPFGADDTSQRLHDRLSYLGFRVIAREAYDLVRKEQKEVDVAMACEMVVHALRDHYDTAIVVSGDRDFIPAIQQVQMAGKRVEVAAFRNAVGSAMMKAGDAFYELDGMPVLSMSNPAAEISLDVADSVAPETDGSAAPAGEEQHGLQ